MGGVTQEAATTLKNTCGTTRSALKKLLVDVFFSYAPTFVSEKLAKKSPKL